MFHADGCIRASSASINLSLVSELVIIACGAQQQLVHKFSTNPVYIRISASHLSVLREPAWQLLIKELWLGVLPVSLEHLPVTPDHKLGEVPFYGAVS